MLRTALKISVMTMVLGALVQSAGAFGHCRGWGCGAGCYAGWCYGGWGYSQWYGGRGYPGYWAPGYMAGSPLAAGYRPTRNVTSDSILLTVNVPRDARIFINDQATTSDGMQRSYTSRGLQSGAVYAYRVRAEFTRDGKPVTEEQTVQMTAGQSRALEFGQAQPEQVAAGVAPGPRETAAAAAK